MTKKEARAKVAQFAAELLKREVFTLVHEMTPQDKKLLWMSREELLHELDDRGKYP